MKFQRREQKNSHWRVAFALLATFACSAAIAADGDVDAKALTRLVTIEAADISVVEVVAASEMRDALTLEAEKQNAGCTDNSCIAEIAAAMGTSHVLQMQLGAVGKTLLFTIQIFDENAKALSRESVRGESVDAISAKLRPALESLFKTAGLTTASKAKTDPRSILVLDLKASVTKEAGQDEPQEAPAATGPNLLFLGGAAITGVGVVIGMLAGGTAIGFIIANSDKANVNQHEVLAWQGATWAAAGVFGVVTVTGLTLLGADLLVGE